MVEYLMKGSDSRRAGVMDGSGHQKNPAGRTPRSVADRHSEDGQVAQFDHIIELKRMCVLRGQDGRDSMIMVCNVMMLVSVGLPEFTPLRMPGRMVGLSDKGAGAMGYGIRHRGEQQRKKHEDQSNAPDGQTNFRHLLLLDAGFVAALLVASSPGGG
jgi:hypothetical protein